MKYHRTLNERKMVVFVVQTSRYFGPCRILPYPAVSCRILPYLPYPAVSCRILPYPAYPAVSCRLLPSPAVSCRILPYPAVSCRILPYPAISCPILPYPALSDTRNRETPFITTKYFHGFTFPIVFSILKKFTLVFVGTL